jgi:hypothetical protein
MLKNVNAQDVRVGQKIYHTDGTWERVTEVVTMELGYKIKIATLYNAATYNQFDTVQVEG